MTHIFEFFNNYLLTFYNFLKNIWLDFWLEVKFIYDNTLDYVFGIFDYSVAAVSWALTDYTF
jgi:hypothetical protein